MKVTLTSACLLLAACASTPEDPGPPPVEAWTTGPVSLPDVPISTAPFDVVHANWKERRAEDYIYLLHDGDYGQAGPRIAELFQEAAAQGAPLRGAPFILFYDDPASTPVSQLRARIGVELAEAFTPAPPLFLDRLPVRPVVYAAIGGAYSQVPLAYPGMLEYMAQRGWTPGIPIRETYLVSPVGAAVESLVTEVQIPWGS